MFGDTLFNARSELADRIINKQWQQYPEYNQIFDASGREKCKRDTEYTIMFLADAVRNNSDAIFTEYIAWLKVLLHSLGLGTDGILENLAIIKETVLETYSSNETAAAVALVDTAVRQYNDLPTEIRPFISPEITLYKEARELRDLLLLGKRDIASQRIQEYVASGYTLKDIYLHLFEPVQKEIGRMWQINQISVAQEHYATAAINLLMAQLYPKLFTNKRKGKTFIGAGIGKELHEIGIRMVTDFLEMEGWDTYFVGSNTPVGDLLKLVYNRKPDLIGLSTTISAHLSAVKDVIDAIHEFNAVSGTTKPIKIMVGGYPFNIDKDLWRKIGADGFATNASDAVIAAQDLTDR